MWWLIWCCEWGEGSDTITPSFLVCLIRWVMVPFIELAIMGTEPDWRGGSVFLDIMTPSRARIIFSTYKYDLVTLLPQGVQLLTSAYLSTSSHASHHSVLCTPATLASLHLLQSAMFFLSHLLPENGSLAGYESREGERPWNLQHIPAACPTLANSSLFPTSVNWVFSHSQCKEP